MYTHLSKKADLSDTATGLGNAATGLAKGVWNTLTTLLPVIGIAGGYTLAKMSNPSAMVEDGLTDNDLLLSALDTEIAATKRKLALMDKVLKAENRRSDTYIFDKSSGSNIKIRQV